MKSKTVASWLALVGGCLGLHRFYLHGFQDTWGWLFPVPTAMGVYGFERVSLYGLDDPLSWILLPIFGLHVAICCLMAIWYGLMKPEEWNQRYNPQAPANAMAGRSNWFTVFALIFSLMVGTAALLSGIAYGTQRYIEISIEQDAHKDLL
ncbi:MAG: hypothetical protein RLZZ397_1255 [Pseudomonadota bacterium]